MMLSFYSTPQTTAEHLFTFHSLFIKHSTCHYSICRKRFEKGFLAKIYCLYASVGLLVYFFPISSYSLLELWVAKSNLHILHLPFMEIWNFWMAKIAFSRRLDLTIFPSDIAFCLLNIAINQKVLECPESADCPFVKHFPTAFGKTTVWHE